MVKSIKPIVVGDSNICSSF